MRELSFLNKGISLTITDKREQDDDGKDITATFLSEGGLSQFVEYLDETRDSLIQNVMYMEGEKMVFLLRLQ